MTLAQDTDLVLLDEPTTYLDLAHQVEVLDLVSGLNRERGRTVAMVLHDLNLAARYSDLRRRDEGRRRGHCRARRARCSRRPARRHVRAAGRRLDDPRTGLPVVVPVSAGASPTTTPRAGGSTRQPPAAVGSPSAAAASCGTYRSSTYGMLSGVTKLCAT